MRNERWATDDEIKRTLNNLNEDESAGGPVLYYSNGDCYCNPQEGHTLILGCSGTGKTRRCIIPTIKSYIKKQESFFVTDSKGIIFRETGGEAAANGFDIRVLNFRKILESEHFNPLALAYELYKSGDPVKRQISLEVIDEMAFSLYPVSDKADPFWAESARSVFVGSVLALFDHADEDEITMASVYQFISRGEERISVGGTVLKEFIEELDQESVAAMLLQSYVSTANDTRAGIRSTFYEGVSMFARSKGLMEMLGSDDLCINKLDGEKAVAIYVILPDEKPIYDRLAGILCEQIMSHYVRLAEDKFNGCLPRRLNVVLEELGNIGKAIQNLPHLMSAGRSRGIRIQIVLQSISQLTDIYSPSSATTILSNADVIMAFRTNNWETLSDLSRKCGEREIDDGNRLSREPLITQSQLSAMGTGQALVIISGRTKFITNLPDYSEMFDFSEWIPPKKGKRSSKSNVSTFNIATYVRMAKRRGFNERNLRKQEASRDEIEDMLISIENVIENEKKQRKNTVVVTDCGKNKDKVIMAISNAGDLPIKTVEKKIKDLPAEFTFKSDFIADLVHHAVVSAGGSVA